MKLENSKIVNKNYIWWLHPSVITFIFILPVYIIIWMIGVSSNGALSTSKALFYLKGDTAWLGVFGIILMGVGTLSPLRPNNLCIEGHKLNNSVLTILGIFSIVGYVFWFKDLFLNPKNILGTIIASTSFSFAIRENLDKQAGIASFAQLGLTYLIGYSYVLWSGACERVTKIQKMIFWIIISAIVFRSFAWAERVALVEAGIAIGFVWVTFRTSSLNKRSLFILKVFPVIGIFCIVLIFALGEYFRSWISYYSINQNSFWEFIFQRLTNYYFNALNTGSGRLEMYQWPTYQFQYTLQWVHKLPFFGSTFSTLVGLKNDNFLYLYGDPEFNNPSGLFSIFYEMGIVFGIIFLCGLGVLSKYTYFYWKKGASFVGAMYFLFIMTFLELFRYFYLGNPRFFMVFFGLSILIVSSKRVRTFQAITA